MKEARQLAASYYAECSTTSSSLSEDTGILASQVNWLCGSAQWRASAVRSVSCTFTCDKQARWEFAFCPRQEYGPSQCTESTTLSLSARKLSHCQTHLSNLSVVEATLHILSGKYAFSKHGRTDFQKDHEGHIYLCFILKNSL